MMFNDDNEHKNNSVLYFNTVLPLSAFFFKKITSVPFKLQLVISRVACVSLHHEQVVKSWASRSEFWDYSHTPDLITNNTLKTISGLEEQN